MAKRIAVVISQGQSQNPAKRKLEEDIVAGLLFEAGLEVTVIPHLYDLQGDGTGMLALQGIKGHFILLSWLYERAPRWTLDRHQIRGHEGPTLIRMDSEDDEDEDEADGKPDAEDKQRVIDQREIPARKIYCVDLRVHNSAEPYLEEVKRIAAENDQKVVQLGGWIQGDPDPQQLARFQQPTNTTALGEGNGHSGVAASPESIEQPTAAEGNGNGNHAGTAEPMRIEEPAARRWYPVIDFSRCTNCMECIDFCLFGVYGVDAAETILVEQPDNCRKGCPACSRVCPENAIMFPQHKTPAIAGAPVMLGGLKIDLSKLFGAPEGDHSAIEVAAQERDEQLMLAGRETVGMQVGIPKRQEHVAAEPKDDLDDLIDALDDMDL